MSNCMPKEQREYIDKIKKDCLESTNMTESEAYSFAFRCWQNDYVKSRELDDLRLYEIAFDLLLKDDCLNDKSWLGTLDELYEGRKEYYMNKAKKKLRQVK